MDGRTGHFQRSPSRKPPFQLRPQPRFIQPPQTPAAGNGIRVFNRPGGGLGPRIPGPIPAGNGAAALSLMRIPLLAKAGLAFSLGFYVGDALINPLLGQKPTFDWGVFNNPDTRRNGEQDPLPPEVAVTRTGEMGSEGAEVFSTNTARTSRRTGDAGACEPGADLASETGPIRITRSGGQLRWDTTAPGACGDLAGAGVVVAENWPTSGNEPRWRQLAGFTSGGFRPPGSIVSASFGVRFVPQGEPLGFLPQPLWVPTPSPTPEVEPQPEAEPGPTPVRRPLAPPPLPQTPPDPVPLPQPEVDPNPRPIPGPAPAPAPRPQPQRIPQPAPVPVPAPSPGRAPAPNNAVPLQNDGAQAPARGGDVIITDKFARYPISQGPNVTRPGPAPTLIGIARETGRIENKLDQMLNSSGNGLLDDLVKWGLLLPFIEEFLQIFFRESTTGDYEVEESCHNHDYGEEGPPSWTVTYPGSTNEFELLRNRIDAIARLMQGNFELEVNTCRRRRAEPEGQLVTVSFESDEMGLGGRAPLRKYMRYRCRPGTTLQELGDHWRNFTWQAGPVCVIHSGASWGVLQVWAASENEGRRVIRHAGATSGVDPDSDGEWQTTGTDNARYGQPGTMRVARRQGFLKVTSRDGPNGLPLIPS